MDIDELLQQAAMALESEIETVRERPSTDLLLGGKRVQRGSSGDETDYLFETHQPAIRFAEKIVARSGEKTWDVYPVSFEKNDVVLRFPEDAGDSIDKLDVEWENDFILQKMLREIDRIEEGDKAKKDRIRRLFDPTVDVIPGSEEPQADNLRNEAQLTAIEKSMKYRSVFIWGPPGTGKTATLGFIIANYLKRGKSVLFASNTNRAVDVGLLSTLHALDVMGVNNLEKEITRFGENALDDDEIREVTFEHQIESIRMDKLEEAAEWSGLIERRKGMMEQVEKRLRDGKQPTKKQNLELEMIDLKISEAGGQETLENKISDLKYVNERSILKKKRFIATTLAKVCTSELFYDLEFDAVVIDEGSMANLPYMMILASRAQWHIVVVGDPMQLPPIALTDDTDARLFLERDIFTTVSGAESTEDLFNWHDSNKEYTSFFDTQYRLRASLADVISTVFYEGRLKSTGAQSDNGEVGVDDRRACHLIDTSKYKPFLEQKSGERGFKPVNVVHQEVLERLIRNMLKRGIHPEEIGVMFPFRHPVYDLRDRFYQNGIRDVEVGTIHTFQGREKPYIIFDTVMSGEFQNGSVRHYSVRPLDEEKNGLSVPRLLNVAFSRSRKELMIIADMKHIDTVYGSKFVGKLLHKIRESFQG